ncbi:MAG: hypothetical protein PHY47_18275 [Lachnospiraceae bacterium]|nr:hypothetical protein [Lachnospiraceae bacterium]
MKSDSKFIYVIRILAGAYLIYLAVPILKNLVNGTTGKGGLWLGIASVLFLIIGAILIAHSGWQIIKQLNEVPEVSAEDEDEGDAVESEEESDSDKDEDDSDMPDSCS